MADAPIPPAGDLVLGAMRSQLGPLIRIKLATPHHWMRVIVCLSCDFELCDLEGRQFDWYLNMLWVFLMCLRERFWLASQRLFWLHYPYAYQGDLYTVTYCLLVLESLVSLFQAYFLWATPVCVDTSCHLVASLVGVGLHYLRFGDIYDSEEYNG